MLRVKEGGDPEAGVVPEMMLHRNLLPANFQPDTKHSIGKVGMYHFDLSSTVTAGTLRFPLIQSLILIFKILGHLHIPLCRLP